MADRDRDREYDDHLHLETARIPREQTRLSVGEFKRRLRGGAFE